jgi:hypothetical protein
MALKSPIHIIPFPNFYFNGGLSLDYYESKLLFERTRHQCNTNMLLNLSVKNVNILHRVFIVQFLTMLARDIKVWKTLSSVKITEESISSIGNKQICLHFQCPSTF